MICGLMLAYQKRRKLCFKNQTAQKSEFWFSTCPPLFQKFDGIANLPAVKTNKVAGGNTETSGLCTNPAICYIRSHISKIGNKKLRNLLFLCSFSACKQNKACKALYDRIVAKGKSKKLTLIAVSNKLLKQAFAIAKSRMPYDAEHRSVLLN